MRRKVIKTYRVIHWGVNIALMSIKPIREMWNSPKEYVNCFIRPGLLPTGGLMVITGEPGVGKSFLAQQTAFELSSGRRWLGLFPSNRVKVAYFELEKRSPIARARFRRDDFRKEYPESVDYLGYYDEDVPRLDTDAGTKLLERLVSDFGTQVVIVDSFATTVWDEIDLSNIKKSVGNYRSIAKKLHLSFILIHHLTKRGVQYDSKKGEWKEPPIRLDNLRGSKFLEYEVDTVIGLTRQRISGIRDIGFLKHSFCPFPYIEMVPLHYFYQASTPKPFATTNHADKILDLIDLGINKVKDLEFHTKISRPTIRKTIDEIATYGLIKKHEGGGKGRESYVEAIDF